MPRLPTLILALLLPAGCLAHAAPPNILFLLSDDQRADTLHALGNPTVQTPNLDRLARLGCSFTRAHIMGGLQGAICVPSRAMLLSGRTLFRVREDLRETPTWPSQLSRAGWRTFLTGKWHNGPASLAAAFDSGEAIFLGGMTDQNRVTVRDLDAAHGLGPERPIERPSSEIFADAAIRFLDRLEGGQPFCLYVAFTSPHDPRNPPPEFKARYEAPAIPLPRNFLPEHPFDNGELAIRDEMLLPHPRSPEAIRAEIAAYYGMISHVDAQVGRILDALRRTGRETNTIVVFAGDNGLALGSHGLLGKQNLYEHSTRVPLVIAGPGIVGNRRSEALVYLSEIAPTLCQLAGVPAPDGAEGTSLVPLLRGGSEPIHRVLFTAYRDVQRAVTDGRWKLIHYPKIDRTQVFDLRADPDERRDLVGTARGRRQRDRLTTLLAGQQQFLGDPLRPQP